MSKLLLISLLASAQAFSAVGTYNLFSDQIPQANGRTRVCALTINSADEKKAFIEQRQKTNEAVDYIELTPNNREPQRNGWMKSVCGELTKKRITCDKLILSAHFGPRIYGDSRKEIDLDYLESLSCSNSCSNLFSNLKETYLFTCNSLSGTADDRRRARGSGGLISSEQNSTRQNYVAIQIAHEASRSWAEEAAEARYGNFSEGGTFGERFLRTFGNTTPGHQIYGFTSVSQLGKDISQGLRQAFRTKQPIEVVLKNKKMVKRSGLLSSDEQSAKRWSCAMLTQAPESVAPAIVKEISSPKPAHQRLYGSLIRFMMEQFTPHHKYREDEIERQLQGQSWLKPLQANEALKAHTAAGLKSKEFPSSSRMRWSTFAYYMGWIGQHEHYTHLSKGMYGLMKPPYNVETRDDVLHHAKLFPDAVRAMGPVPQELQRNPEAREKVQELRALLGL